MERALDELARRRDDGPPRVTVRPAAASPEATAFLPPRPARAVGTFLRVLTVNDVYTLENYPQLAALVTAAKEAEAELDCKAISTMCGDFLSPCVLTSLDDGDAMIKGLAMARVDFASLGNHEFDVGLKTLRDKLEGFSGALKFVNGNVTDEDFASLPKYEVVQVGERRAVISGYTTEDLSKYSPGCEPSVVPINDAVLATWELAKSELGGDSLPDLFLPMTHQFSSDDRRTALALEKHPELCSRTPLLLAGHDHEMLLEEVGKALIVKVGCDATKIGVIDVWWGADGVAHTSLSIVHAAELPKEQACADFVKAQDDFLEQMMAMPLMDFPQPSSTKRVRFEESRVASFLLDCVVRGMKGGLKDHLPAGRHSIDAAVTFAGCVRGKREYEPGQFTMGDLYAEFPYELPQAVVMLPGEVLSSSIFSTRDAARLDPAKGSNTFLHCDSRTRCDEGHRLVTVGGKPYDAQAMYCVAMPHGVLTGLGKIEPLLSYVRGRTEPLPDIEVCRGAKELIVGLAMEELWDRLLAVENLDPTQVEAKLKETFAAMDDDGDGRVTKEELLAKLGGSTPKPTDVMLAGRLIEHVDADGDGIVSHDELRAFLAARWRRANMACKAVAAFAGRGAVMAKQQGHA